MSAPNLDAVTDQAIQAYREHADALIAHVDGQLFEHPRIAAYLGGNPRELLRANHRNHHQFLCNVLTLRDGELLAQVVPWVYRAYHGQGISLDYFPTELEAWIAALEALLEPRIVDELRPLYSWMIEAHDHHCSLAGKPGPPPAVPESWLEAERRFRNHLVAGRAQEASALIQEQSESGTAVKDVYLHIIQPAMVEIGLMWERGEISVAHEHMATSIVQRVLSSCYQRIGLSSGERGRAVVAAAPREMHEIGARMFADLLEEDCWEVFYLGADTPPEELRRFVREVRPNLLGLSVCLPFNLQQGAATIAAVRADGATARCRILVGGQAFAGSTDRWRRVGADGYADDAAAGVAWARREADPGVAP
jgi:methanogenic corrinoid protein MtbC1